MSQLRFSRPGQDSLHARAHVQSSLSAPSSIRVHRPRTGIASDANRLRRCHDHGTLSASRLRLAYGDAQKCNVICVTTKGKEAFLPSAHPQPFETPTNELSLHLFLAQAGFYANFPLRCLANSSVFPSME